MVKKIDILFTMFIVFTISGCAPMRIQPIENGGCKLSGFGSGKGSIEGKCSVEKSLITIPNLDVRR